MKNKGIKLLIAILAILIVIAGVLLVIKFVQNQNSDKQTSSNSNIFLGFDTGKNKEPQINIYNGNERAIAVMIDNHKGAWPQARTK